MTPADRFMTYVDTTGECWTWVGYIRPKPIPYGRFSVGGRRVQAHRFAYETFVGPIPEGMEVDHLCRNTLCVRPDHLETVTRAENIARAAAAQTHCSNGHEYDEANTLIQPNGRRSCRACRRDRVRKFRAS